MENSNTLRYRVAMKKGRRLFNMTAGSLMILGGSAVVVLTVIVCISEQNTDFYTFAGGTWIPLLFILFGIIGIIPATKRIEVYRGKIIYHVGFKNKEYRMSDIKTSKTQTETYNTGLYHEDIVPADSYDKVTVFYDEKGKKIFEFGLDYDNVQLLVRDVKNTQRSISNQKKKK